MPTILLPLIGPRMDVAGVLTRCLQLFHTSGLTRTHSVEQFFLSSGITLQMCSEKAVLWSNSYSLFYR